MYTNEDEIAFWKEKFIAAAFLQVNEDIIPQGKFKLNSDLWEHPHR